MIEVLFGESEAGAMKYAKSNRKIRKWNEDGLVSVYGDASLLPVREEWISVPGNASEVICLPYMLDIGDIQKPFDSSYRKDMILSMYTQSGWDNSESFLRELEEAVLATMQEYGRLFKMLESSRAVRIWYSRAAYSLCGFYWLCGELRNVDCEISVIELPEHIEKEEHTIIQYRNWGEVEAESMSSFLPLEKRLSVNEKKLYAQKWEELVQDNSPLRAVINNELVGVPENFYDFLIRKMLTVEPVKEARLIGKILGRYPLSTSDWWYAARIEKMIQTGEIRVLEDSEQKYTRLLCVAK